jgi:hypothetical protein
MTWMGEINFSCLMTESLGMWDGGDPFPNGSICRFAPQLETLDTVMHIAILLCSGTSLFVEGTKKEIIGVLEYAFMEPLGGMDHIDRLMQLNIGRVKCIGLGLLEDSVERR